VCGLRRFARTPESIDSRANAGLSKKGRLGKHGDIQRACIKPGGMIYLSAGAILTPTLLMNSGIGPAEVVGNIKGVELVKDIPAVGQNLQDRIATTLLVFLDRKIPAGELNVTLGSTTGFQVTGADCPTDFGIGDVSLDCTYVNSEEGSGFKAIDLFLATRVVLPTALRTAPETDFLVSIVAECYDNQDSILCAPLKPVFECFRKVVGFFTFPPVTKSRGSVTVNEGGEPIVFGNFFSDEEGIDISSAVTGLRTTIRMVGSGEFDGILQERGPLSCPAFIFNKLLDMLIVATRPLSDISFTDEATLPSLTAFLEAMQKGSPEETAGSQQAQDMLYAHFLHRRRQDVMARETEGQGASPWLGGESAVATWLRQQLEMAKAEASSHAMALAPERAGLHDEACESDPQGDVCVSAQLEAARRFAVLPPLPTDVADADGLEEIVKTAGTTAYHWAGSAAMGSVVDSRFRVEGIDSLSVCDASVLPQVSQPASEDGRVY